MTEQASVREVCSVLFKCRINSLPIVDKKNHVVGIVAKEDILHLFYPDYKEYIDDMFSTDNIETLDNDFAEIMKRSIKNVMNRTVMFTRPGTSVMRALARMIARHVEQLPVVNDDGKLIGLVTKGDIFNALYRFHGNILKKYKKK